MLDLTAKQYEEFGESFIKFYLEGGFGSKSKKEIELKTFSLLSKSFKNKKPISLAKELGITVTRLENLIVQTRLIKQSNPIEEKEELLKVLMQTKWAFSDGFVKFILADPFVKMNFQAYCEDCNVLYDMSFNRNIIKMSVKDLAEVITNIANIDEKTNLKIGDEILSIINKEDLKDSVVKTLDDATTHYTGVAFSKIPDVVKCLLKEIKNKIRKE